MNLRRLTLTIGCIFILLTTHLAQTSYDYNDGPYLHVNRDSMQVLWIENGDLNKSTIPLALPYHFESEVLPSVTINDLTPQANPFERYKDVKKFVALSDIHGQHHIFIKLLKKHQVIDSNEAWIYGEGHLVIVGDIMDRGPQVTESLWFLYRLEKEAATAGGKVHTLLGNHELMVMHGDLGYINPKYRYTSGISQIPYPDFFNSQTVLGQWLRSKNITTVINEFGFVHGGFSESVIKKEKSLSTINDMFKTQILPHNELALDSTSLLSMLNFDNGPLWYRGYANPEGFDEEAADRILAALDIKSIVVGHTSMPKIVSVHDDKILLVDSSIKFGKKGELLIYDNGSLWRGLIDGNRIPIDTDIDIDIDIENTASNEHHPSTPFQYVNDFDANLTIVLNTDLPRLFKKNNLKEIYQPATMVAVHNNEIKRKWNVRVRTRGNMRKQVSKFPPLKIDFSKSTLAYLGFTSNDKLKLVLPRTSNKNDEQRLLREYVIYKMYQQVDSLGFRTHLLNVIFENKGKKKYELTGFCIEDETDFALRTKTKVVDSGVLREAALEREHYVKMLFFQYMILNTDFSVSSKHNLEIINIPGHPQILTIPYDFDYSGMVDHNYAVPYELLPISSVRVHYFKGQKITLEEVKTAVEFFKPLEDTFKKIINDANYLDKKSKKIMKMDIDEFYLRLKEEDQWEKRFINPKKRLEKPR